MISGTMEGVNLEQVERLFGLTLTTRVWSTRSSINCPRMPPGGRDPMVGAMLRSVEADDAPDVDTSVH